MDKNKPLTLLEVAEAAKKRVALISKEFSHGFEFLLNYPRSVTFFGSARAAADNHYYKKAEKLAGRIVSELHYSVFTGGGPGIMSAANKGAYEAGGNSLGLTIDLPEEQETNKFLTDKIDFHYFFSRKVCLSYSAEAYIFFPGGFGTLDEFTEILTLVQTRKIPKAPMICVGEEYWKPLVEYFRKHLVPMGTVSEEDLELFTITDDDDQIIQIIKESPIQLGVRYKGGTDLDGQAPRV